MPLGAEQPDTASNEALMGRLISGRGISNSADNRGKTAYELALKWGNAGAASAIESSSDFRQPDRKTLFLDAVGLWGTMECYRDAGVQWWDCKERCRAT